MAEYGELLLVVESPPVVESQGEEQTYHEVEPLLISVLGGLEISYRFWLCSSDWEHLFSFLKMSSVLLAEVFRAKFRFS